MSSANPSLPSVPGLAPTDIALQFVLLLKGARLDVRWFVYHPRLLGRYSLSRTGHTQHSRGPTRTTVVWAAFVTSMTAVAVLLLLSDSPSSTSANFPPPATNPSIMGQSLATSENSWVPDSSVSIDHDRWSHIIIHHSGRMTGKVRDLDARAKSAGLNGLGYHFVIGNGAGLSDGVVEEGYRWTQQLPGAHVAISSNATKAERDKANRLNSRSIGICVIGNGDRQPFTEAQLRALIELVRSLQQTWDIPATGVRLHSDVSLDSGPGRFFPTARLEAHTLP
jgi:hypothetical protein